MTDADWGARLNANYAAIDSALTDTWGTTRGTGFLSSVMHLISVLFRRRQHTLHLVFDRMPDHDGARFIEAEDAQGRSVRAGNWFIRSDGLAELVIRL